MATTSASVIPGVTATDRRTSTCEVARCAPRCRAPRIAPARCRSGRVVATSPGYGFVADPQRGNVLRDAQLRGVDEGLPQEGERR